MKSSLCVKKLSDSRTEQQRYKSKQAIEHFRKAPGDFLQLVAFWVEHDLAVPVVDILAASSNVVHRASLATAITQLQQSLQARGRCLCAHGTWVASRQLSRYATCVVVQRVLSVSGAAAQKGSPQATLFTILICWSWICSTVVLQSISWSRSS